jgi:hypothetical protein
LELDYRKIGAAALVLLVSLGLGFYVLMEVDESSKSFQVNATVLEEEENETVEAGIAAGQGMTFGRFSELFNKTKTLQLSSNNLTMVKVSASGNISDKLHFKERKLFQNSTEIPVEMSADSPGFYSGEIRLDLKTGKNSWGETWLKILYKYF